MTMNKTESEAARAVRGIVDAICAGVRWPACFDVALAAIEREDAERAVMAEVKAVDHTLVAAEATDDGPIYWTPPPGVAIPEWAGVIAWSAHPKSNSTAFVIEGSEPVPFASNGRVLFGERGWAPFALANDPTMIGQWRLIRRREPEPAADEVARLREELSDVREELGHVLADWNALVAAIGAPTNGGAVGYGARLREELAEVRELAWAQAQLTRYWKTDRDAWVHDYCARKEEVERLQARLARLARIAQEAKS